MKRVARRSRGCLGGFEACENHCGYRCSNLDSISSDEVSSIFYCARFLRSKFAFSLHQMEYSIAFFAFLIDFFIKGTPCITDYVMAELEKLGQKYRVALR